LKVSNSSFRIQKASENLSKVVITGWIMSLAGLALWLYGYFSAGHPSLVDWHANSPWWIADYLPNVESEIGIVLMFAALIPIYWPSKR
jgi:hypothetical protein